MCNQLHTNYIEKMHGRRGIFRGGRVRAYKTLNCHSSGRVIKHKEIRKLREGKGMFYWHK